MKTKNETILKAEKGKQETFFIREFDYPRELVFKAFIDPKLIIQWLGPRDLQMRIDKYEAKAGGSYRYVHFRKVGVEYGFRGVFHECVAPERIIQTFEFEGMPVKGCVCLSTTLFEVLPNNRTRVTIQDVYQSVTDRDGAVASGMEGGVIESNERLDELLEKLIA